MLFVNAMARNVQKPIVFLCYFWQISEIRCAVAQNHTKSKKNVVLSWFLFKIGENRCTVVQNR